MKKFCKVYHTLLMVVCVAYVHAEIFENIDVLKQYAKDHPFSIPIDNQDYLNPEYTKYLEASMPTRLDTILMTIGLKHKSEWKPQAFIDLLHRVTQKRKKDGCTGRFLERHEVSQDDHFLVWGNLQGALHSFVYTLEHLIEQKILDKNLKVIAPKYFLVFSGNVIDRSIYSLETLAIVLRLLDANPTRVFYVKGDHETDDKWVDYDSKDELEYKVSRMLGKLPPYKDMPFMKDMDDFFDTLPLALYLGMRTVDNADGIRIGYTSRSEFQLSYDELVYLLNATEHTILPLPIKVPKERADEKPGDVVAMTEGSSDLIPDYNSQGLRLLPPDQGTMAWSILSAQTESFQKLYKFFTDSYVDITISLPMKKTTITQHYQDARNRSGFKTGRVYNMFSGQSDEQFRSQQKIEIVRVGSTLDLEGESAILGTQIRFGMALATNKQNQQGIVPGHIVQLMMMNDNHILSQARRNAEILLKEYKAPILMGVEENIMARSYFDLIKEQDCLVLFPFTGLAALRSAEYPKIMHYGPSYTQEANISTRYILDTIGPNKIAIFYEKGQLGEDGLVGVRAACEAKGFASLIEVPFMSTQLNFKDQIDLIRHENPDIIGIFCSAAIGQEFIRQAGAEVLGQKTLYGLSSFGLQSFRQYYRSKGLHMITTHLVPSPFSSEVPIAQEFKKEALENNVVISPETFKSYVIGSIFVEALRIIKGPITLKSIKQSLESMKDYAFKGLTLNFDPKTRVLMNTIWLDLGDGEEKWKSFNVNKYTLSAEEKIEADQKVLGRESSTQKKAAPAPQPKNPAPKMPASETKPAVPEQEVVSVPPESGGNA